MAGERNGHWDNYNEKCMWHLKKYLVVAESAKEEKEVGRSKERKLPCNLSVCNMPPTIMCKYSSLLYKFNFNSHAKRESKRHWMMIIIFFKLLNCSLIYDYHLLLFNFRRQLTDNQLHTIEKDAFADLMTLERLWVVVQSKKNHFK